MHAFDIAFKGLGAGQHRFEWELGDDFFAAFENEDIHGGQVHVDLLLNKSAAGLGLEFEMEGAVRVDCDRCNEECEVPVEFDGGFRVSFHTGAVVKGGAGANGGAKGGAAKDVEDDGGMGDGTFDGEIMWLVEGQGVLNVAQYIYESVVLSLPMQRTHHDCTPKGVNFVSEEDFARAEQGSQMQKMSDNPEWQKLAALQEGAKK